MSVQIRYSKSPELSLEEKKVLLEIRGSRRYPICRFELRSSKEKSLVSTALDTVHLENPAESMELLKARAAVLESLAEKELIYLNYRLISYVKSDYTDYHESAVFALLCKMVEEGKEKNGFLFDYAFLKKGRAALTARGRYAIS